MKKRIFFSLILVIFLTALAFSTARAQEPAQTDNQTPNQTVRPFKILEELGLTRDQIQQIRRINQARKPIMQEAQRRWQMARRNLDLAIYADETTDDQMKVSQSELLKERTLTEYLIRKVLTPEQLVKFRQLREQLIQRMNALKNRNNPDNPNTEPQKPLNRFQQRRNQNRPQ
jgi:Spy/CpxP family protein refolding chaperone